MSSYIYHNNSRRSHKLASATMSATVKDIVDPVGEHDGDHQKAREIGLEREHAGVRLRVILVAVINNRTYLLMCIHESLENKFRVKDGSGNMPSNCNDTK